MGEKVKKIMDFSDKIIPRDDKKTLSEVGSAKISYGHFNLNHFPWWGGQFERMIGLVKAALNKTIRNGVLRWKELQEVLLDVKLALNNLPLSYIEEDLQFPMLTPNSMLFLNTNLLPKLQRHHIESADLCKNAKHLLNCKEAMWGRCTREYLHNLCETPCSSQGSQSHTSHRKCGDYKITREKQWKVAAGCYQETDHGE